MDIGNALTAAGVVVALCIGGVAGFRGPAAERYRGSPGGGMDRLRADRLSGCVVSLELRRTGLGSSLPE
jgi:hypothetical protein